MHVKYLISALPLLACQVIATPVPEGSQLIKRSGEGVHLVNCGVKNGARISQMMYWRDDSRANGFTAPDDRTTVSNNGYVTWEGRSVSGRFNSGVTFTSNIQSNGSGLPAGTRAGTGYNGSNWVCFRDNGRSVYSDGGYGCSGIYYCLKPRDDFAIYMSDYQYFDRRQAANSARVSVECHGQSQS